MSNYYNRQWRLPNNENKDKQSNYSMDFNNVLGIETSLDVNEFSQITFSFWFKTSAQQNSKYIISMPDGTAANGVEATFTNTAVRYRLTGQTTDTSIDATFTYYDNNWHHIVCTYDGTTQKIYVDGSLSNSGSANNGTLKTNYNKLYIGSFNWVYGLGPDVTLDGVAIFDYALSASQVTTLYGSSSTGIGNPMSLSPKPVAWYNLGDQDSFNGADYLVPNSSLKDYVFDFSSDLIDSNFSLTTGQTQFSASIWVKFTGSLGNDESLIANESGYSADGFAIFKNASNTIEFKCESQSAVGTTTIALNKWYLATATYNAGAMVLYVNGQQEATQTTATSITQPSTPKTRLGKYITGNVIPFTGELSNAQIFNTALSSTDVETLYNNGSPLTSMSGFTSLQGWWKLDASELYSDKWSVENNASPTTFKSALNFDGSNDYIDLGNLQPSTTSLSISAWAYKTDATNASIIGRGASVDYGIFIYSGSLMFGLNSGSWSTIAISNFTSNYLNQWFHVCATWDGSTMKLYLNGNEEASASKTGTITYTSNDTTIGKNSTLSGFEWDGKISNVAIYNTALSASNITTLYNNGVPQATIYGSPVSHWKLDNTTTGIEDSAGSNNGTNNGATEVATYVNATAGTSSGMTQANLVQSDLSFTSGYSPYALNFDGTNDYIDCGTSQLLDFSSSFTISAWVYITSTASGYDCVYAFKGASNAFVMFFNNGVGYSPISFGSANYPTDLTIKCATNVTINKWNNIVIVYNGNGIATPSNYTFYIDNTSHALTNSAGFSDNGNVNYIGRYASSHSFTGSLSNISIWNAALTSAQVSELYNEGVPSNLNNHSAYSNLLSWWQLGSNSSFSTNWTVLDEKGSNDGTSVGMTEDDIVDGVGSYANGTSSGMGGDEIIGSAPFSDANSLSVNMDVLDRVSDTPS